MSYACGASGPVAAWRKILFRSSPPPSSPPSSSSSPRLALGWRSGSCSSSCSRAPPRAGSSEAERREARDGAAGRRSPSPVPARGQNRTSPRSWASSSAWSSSARSRRHPRPRANRREANPKLSVQGCRVCPPDPRATAICTGRSSAEARCRPWTLATGTRFPPRSPPCCHPSRRPPSREARAPSLGTSRSQTRRRDAPPGRLNANVRVRRPILAPLPRRSTCASPASTARVPTPRARRPRWARRARPTAAAPRATATNPRPPPSRARRPSRTIASRLSLAGFREHPRPIL
mmetsp:Transcript_12141/g.48762  ORF Transcript_12141/g.48762 Transcript_12141/m.48762 type:complete len:291 (-) Transcript_12141:594-1466(-)